MNHPSKDNPKPNHCEECGVKTGFLYQKQVDSFGRMLWLCGSRNFNCIKDIQDF